MAEQPNPFEIVEQLNRAMYGEPASRSPGLFDKIDSLTMELGRLNQRLDRMERKKHSVSSWTTGYISFCASGIFAVIAIFNLIPRTTILDIPVEFATFLALVLAAVALYFFLTGFGWIGGNDGTH
jgi:hypothetical protein